MKLRSETRGNVRIFKDDDDGQLNRFSASPDIVHASSGMKGWSASIRTVACCRVTFGEGTAYVVETNDPVNCLACIAEDLL